MMGKTKKEKQKATNGQPMQGIENGGFSSIEQITNRPGVINNRTIESHHL